MQLERMEGGASRIVSVDALDGDTFGVTLESGHTILLELGTGFVKRPSLR